MKISLTITARDADKYSLLTQTIKFLEEKVKALHKK